MDSPRGIPFSADCPTSWSLSVLCIASYRARYCLRAYHMPWKLVCWFRPDPVTLNSRCTDRTIKRMPQSSIALDCTLFGRGSYLKQGSFSCSLSSPESRSLSLLARTYPFHFQCVFNSPNLLWFSYLSEVVLMPLFHGRHIDLPVTPCSRSLPAICPTL